MRVALPVIQLNQLWSAPAMPFAIELHFDDHTNGQLMPTWTALQSITGISTGTALGVAPHVSLAVLSECPAGLQQAMQSLARSMAQFDLPLGDVESFPGDKGVVFIAAHRSSRLLEAHAAVSKILNEFNVTNSPLYELDRWRPHCTIATDVPVALMPKVTEAAASLSRPATARVVALCGVHYRPATLAFRMPIGVAGGPAAI